MTQIFDKLLLAKAREVVATELNAVAALRDQLTGDLVAVAKLMLDCQGHVLTAGAISKNDLVYIISKGGQSEEINTFARIAKDRGATIVAHTERPDAPLGRLSDAVIHVVAPEDVDPYGMIATGSSLMNGAACDVLCVLLLELRGYTQEAFAHTHPRGAVGKRIAKGR